jgi:hypothetical protein
MQAVRKGTCQQLASIGIAENVNAIKSFVRFPDELSAHGQDGIARFQSRCRKCVPQLGI